MKDTSFLMDVYLGRLDADRLVRFREVEMNERTREVIRAFRDINHRYPAGVLDETGVLPPEVLQELKQIGFFGLSIPERYGGVGLDLLQYLRVVEEIIAESMSLGFTSLAHLSIGVKGIVLFGTDEQKQTYLPQAASGEMIFSYALTEPRTGSDAKHIETTARLSDDGRHYILNGQKTYITNANFASGLTVFAQLEPKQPGKMGAFIVETAWDGVTVGKDMPKMGLKTSSTAPIRFKNVQVPRENLIGRPGDGFKIAMTVLNYGRLALGAGSAGIMRRSLADMTRRAASREQFGVPINSFELIQEKLVRARVNGAVASAMTAFAANLLMDDPLAAVAAEGSHCKLFGTTRAWDTLYDALQTAGGAGYLSTQPYERRMRDFRVTTIFEGTTEIHSIYPALFALRRLARQMQADDNAAARLRFVAGIALRRMRFHHRFGHPDMDRALRFARANARRLRLLLAAGLLLFGKNVARKEFFLRRITHLSLYLFGILASLARIDAARRAGEPTGEELRILAYFIEEARRARRQDGWLLPGRMERIHHRIAQDVIHGRRADDTVPPARAAAASGYRAAYDGPARKAG
jgi:acyl-CoA dehydrogenase family protein 9